MGSWRHSTKRAPTGRRIARPGTLKIGIIYSSVIKKQSFHTCPKRAKKSSKWAPKWSQKHLNSVPDTCLKKHENRVWKSAHFWAPRVPKLSPKMQQKSSKIRSRAPLGRGGVPGVDISWILAPFWLHFGINLDQNLEEIGLLLPRFLVPEPCQGFRDSGIQECRDSGMQGFRDPGIQGLRNSGMQEFRASGIQ